MPARIRQRAPARPAAGRTWRRLRLRVGRLPFEGRLDRGDVDFLHRHHRVEGASGGCDVGADGGVKQDAWRDLPGEAPPVLTPAAGALLAAVLDDRVPVA